MDCWCWFRQDFRPIQELFSCSISDIMLSGAFWGSYFADPEGNEFCVENQPVR
jgi:hypothetical protein